MDYLEKNNLLNNCFGLSTLCLVIRMVRSMVVDLSGKAKTSDMVTVICGIKNIHFLAPWLLVFLVCRFKSKVLGVGAKERSWGDVKTIKSGKRSAISSDVS